MVFKEVWSIFEYTQYLCLYYVYSGAKYILRKITTGINHIFSEIKNVCYVTRSKHVGNAEEENIFLSSELVALRNTFFS